MRSAFPPALVPFHASETVENRTKKIENPTITLDCYWRSHIYLVSSCYVYRSVCCALYVRMCEWFFECAMRALVGFRGVGWPVRWRHLSKGAGQSALRK